MADQQERPSDLDLGWLIGATEGEGCFTVLRSKWRHDQIYYSIAVIISNTHPEFIEKLARILTEARVGHHVRWRSVEQQLAHSRLVKRPLAQVTIWGVGRVKQFLGLTEGLWTSKRRQADVLTEFSALPRPYKGAAFETLYERNKALNKGILTDYTLGQPPAA